MLGSFFNSFFEQVILLISYISNGGSFPKPLSAADEAECLRKHKAGDNQARNKLVEHNLRLVAHIAKKYSTATRSSEDLISIGTIGLMKGINTFSCDKGTKLATYLARCIENEILMVIRANKKTQGDISLNGSIGTDKEGNEISLIDIMSSEGDEIFDTINHKMQVGTLYERVQDELDEREFDVIRYRYGLFGEDSLTQREIAKTLKISRSYVSRIEKRAINKLKKHFV